jgi:uncharacterized Zn finger protein
MNEEDSAAVEGPSEPAARRLHSAELECEVCGRATQQRVLKLETSGPGATDRSMRGVARCGVCHWTHPFSMEAPRNVGVSLVVSDGSRSSPERRELPAGRRVQVGSRVPRSDPPLKILRIDRRDGRRVPEARTEEVATLWVSPDRGLEVPVSLLLGRRTQSIKLPLSPEDEITIGGELRVPGGTVRVVGIRSGMHTWHGTGDHFPAGSIVRIYARRTVMPPDGKSPWMRSRETPRSPASSFSRESRSRSSPGVRTKRTSPRARRAAGGATDQSEPF